MAVSVTSVGGRRVGRAVRWTSTAVLVGTAALVGPSAATGAPALAEPCASARETEAAALAEAVRCGLQVAVTGLTSETTEVTALPSGQSRAVVSAGVVRVRRDGRWTPVDLTLRESPDGSVVPVADPFGARLSGARSGPGPHQLAELGAGADRLSLGWTGPLPRPALAGNRATYVDALPGVDLAVEVSRKGIETFLVVKSRAGLAHVRRVTFPVTGERVGGHGRDAGGNVTITDPSGRAIATSPAPEMWDAASDPQGAAVGRQAPVPVGARVESRRGLAGGAATVHLTLEPDPAWLTSPGRAYPIVIDPTINPVSATFDTYVREDYTSDRSGTNDLQVGRAGSTGPIARSFVHWNISAFTNQQVTSATVYFWNWYSATCDAKGWQIWSTGPASTATRWTNQPTWYDADPATAGAQPEATSTATRGNSTACNDNWVAISGTSFFRRAAAAGQDTAYMGVRGSSETDWLHFKQFRSTAGGNVPYAVVTYNRYSQVTARATVPASACVEGAGRPALSTLTPTLQATVSDPDGTAMSVTFEWWTLTGSAPVGTATATGVASGTTASRAVPAGSIAVSGNYKWRVTVSDGTGTTTSSWCEFTLYDFAPPAEGCENGVPGDFNGDGTRDVAIADPEATVGGHAKAGLIQVIDGATGAVATVHQDLEEVPGGAEPGDRYGHALAVYDANRDGCADLVVGAPFEDMGAEADAGWVTIVFGSQQGLGKGPATVEYSQNSTGVPDANEAGDWFGYSLAAGTTATGEPFLVIGAPGEDIGAAVDAGIVHYLRGTTNTAVWQGSGAGGSAETDDRLGYSVAASPHHIVAGMPGEEPDSAGAFAGAVVMFTHPASAGAPVLVDVVSQYSPGVSGIGEPGDLFGKSVALAPYRPVGTPPGHSGSLLVVGAPGEDIGEIQDAGTVHRFHLTAAGYTELTSMSQGTAGVVDRSESGDYFGERVVVINTDPAAEASASTLLIAVGTPGEDITLGDGTEVADAGVVHVLAGAAATITADTDVHRAAGALPGGPTQLELIGQSLGASPQHLYVAAPWGDGSVWALPWTSLAGGAATPAHTWQPGQGGMPADAVAFGAVIA